NHENVSRSRDDCSEILSHCSERIGSRERENRRATARTMFARRRSPERDDASADALFPAYRMCCGETAGWRSQQGELMLDERQTLTILSWTVGTVCIGTLVLSALSLH